LPSSLIFVYITITTIDNKEVKSKVVVCKGIIVDNELHKYQLTSTQQEPMRNDERILVFCMFFCVLCLGQIVLQALILTVD
jgi:hypothetical protein